MRVRSTQTERSRQAGFSLADVAMSMAIVSMLFGGIMSGYVQSVHRAEWSAYSLAAHSQAIQSIEQARACKWDPAAYPPVDELVSANFPMRVDVLDIPVNGHHVTYATNYISITMVSLDPPLKRIRADAVWSMPNRHPFTNTIVTYRAPDQ